jgi:sulfur carrier protein ThiS
LKVYLTYIGFYHAREIQKVPEVELPEGSTVRDLFLRLGLREEGHGYVHAFINKDAAWKSTELKEEDAVTIVSMVAGG